ncbi:MAG TPA: apolipoprotein N-acyltransferase [Pseudonocardiaceae bacterium]|nr:apolipoprotein N-acyltransferase [Pseudonocardiaceae bacterium]
MVTPTVTADDSDETLPPSSRVKRRRPRPPSGATLLRLVASVGGGLLWYLSFPPRPVWWLALPAFALLGLAIRGLRARAGFGYAFGFGLAFMLPLLHWTSLYVGNIAWFPLSLAEAVLIGLAGAGIAIVAPMRGGPLWAALVWVAGEAIRARVPFGGFPWGKIAFGQPDGPFVSLAAVAGTPLVGFAVALAGFGLTALVVALAAKDRTRATLIGAVVAIVVPVAASLAWWPMVGTDPNAGTTVVAAVQGNVPRLGLDFNAQRRAVLDDHVAETNRLAAQVAAGRTPRPQLVIWPENSSDIDPYANPDAFAEISQAAAAIKAPISVGAVVTSQGPQPKNTAILWEPGKGPVEQYVKRKLQPFGETMPYRSFFAHFSSDVAIAGNFAPGTRPVVFPMGPAKVALDTCYEVAFDDVVRASIPGSTLLAVPTNNATFGLSDMTYQQLAMDQVRAVEHGRSVVVAATSGVSAIIQPDGRVTQQTGLFTPGALVARVPLRSTTTLADRVGAWPEWAMVAGALLALAFGITGRVRRRRTTTGTPQTATIVD